MKPKRNKTMMIIALVSIFACGGPGCFLFYAGFRQLASALGAVSSFEDLLQETLTGFANGGWLVCPSVIVILIPVLLVLIALLGKGKKEKLEGLDPTGISQEDPLPPPS